MHGREAEETKRIRWHMWPGAAAATPSVATIANFSSSSSKITIADSFCKDGRKISVGDCALFQGRDSPPFIGIIRSLASGKEDSLLLGVNWLYRPADVKLGKGILLEAAPNEVFYSFHKDEIPAASLLHPCKVAFLRKDIELPSGLSSFVCRRVYDIENHCLWWLTDQDYINERQEEVDKLLDKTRLEMHAGVQPGGRSPKPSNAPSTTQPLKPGTDSVQNSLNSFPSQGNKGKKRERGGDPGPDPIKRERSSKTDDSDSGHSRLDSMIKAEIAKITDKGALINMEGVEKLVHLMQLYRTEKKIDMVGRILLADVVAATDKIDFLERFVHLRGVPVLDDWLQEVHKGKVGDGNSPKESDKSVEELLLALLRALDKLPVNLHALQTCNVGKSVNHLRSHKNLEIQKKARSLVDTWKKRVEEEMKIIEANSGSGHQAVSWHGKPGGYSEASHGGGNRRSGPCEVALKGYNMQTSAPKTTGSIKLSHGDAIAKPTSASAGSVKLTPSLPVSAPLSSKDLYCKTAASSGISDVLPATSMKEEKSSSSSQSQNNSQSCSSDHKAVASAWKEDARSSTAGSISANKTSTTAASRTRRSSNCVLASGVPGVQKESILGKPNTSNRNNTPDKAAHSGLTSERMLDMPPADHGNNHRLIVRLPNPSRSPARSASGGSFDDPPIIGSRASSPVISERHDHCDRRAKGKTDTCQASNMVTDVNTESWQSNDVKDGLVGSDEGDRSSTAVVEEERGGNTDETAKPTTVSKDSCISTIIGKGDFSSINALIESCVKYSEASASLSTGDDMGMNLLATVAAGEMSRSYLVSPGGSPDRSPLAMDNSLMGKSKLSRDDVGAQAHSQPDDDGGPMKLADNVEPLPAKDELLQVSNAHATVNMLGDSKSSFPLSEHKPIGEQSEHLPSSMDLHQTAEPCVKSDVKADETGPTGCVTEPTGLTRSEALSVGVRDGSEGEKANQRPKRRKASVSVRSTDYKPRLRSASSDQNKAVERATEKVAQSGLPASSNTAHGNGCDIDQAALSINASMEEALEEPPSCPPSKIVNEIVDRGHERIRASISTEQQPPPVAANHVEASDRIGELSATPSCSGNAPCPDNFDESNKAATAEGLGPKSILGHSVSDAVEQTALAPPCINDQALGNVGLPVLGRNSSDRVEEISERKVPEHCFSVSAPCEDTPVVLAEQRMEPTGLKLPGAEAAEKKECFSGNEAGSEMASKLDFDLNEGFPVDEGNQNDLATLSAAPECSSSVHLPSPVPFSLSPMPSSLPASITVASPARGAFVHPENLLRSKGELGWKGSASTSAFRPAEPRRVLEMPLSTIDAPSSDITAGKQGRPALDIDLNVPDERVTEDMTSQSSVQETGSNGELGRSEMFSSPVAVRSAGLDLDLNRADESAENAQFLAGTSRGMEVPLFSVRSSSSSGFPNNEMNALRDFDLNNGPGLDEAGSETVPRSQHNKSSGPFFPPYVAGLRMSNTEYGSLSSWLPSGTSYSAVTIPSFLSDRGDQPYPMVATAAGQRVLGSATNGTFGGDIYRGPVLSSPAMAFSPATAFPYTGFSFGTSFPLAASTSFSGGLTTYMDSSSGGGPCFPAISSQLVGPNSAVSSQYPRPYMSLQEGTTGTSSGGGPESSRKCGRQGLDLNSGPGNTDEGRDERLLPSVSRRFPVSNPQVLAEEHARIYQQAAAVASGILKRKEPDGGGWDGDRFSNYKQSSWHQ